jgi:hypothetical protein
MSDTIHLSVESGPINKLLPAICLLLALIPFQGYFNFYKNLSISAAQLLAVLLFICSIPRAIKKIDYFEYAFPLTVLIFWIIMFMGIYVSNNRQKPEFFSENKVAHAPVLRKAMTEISQHGRLISEDFDKVELYTSKFQAPAEDYWKFVAKTAAVGGMMTPDNFSAIEITNVLAQLKGTEEKNYVLQDAVHKSGLTISSSSSGKTTRRRITLCENSSTE